MAIVVGTVLTLGAVALGVRNLNACGWGFRVSVAYIPFDVYTFVDVNSSGIERGAYCAVRLSEADARALRAIIASARPGQL